jgi:hypothetical protein
MTDIEDGIARAFGMKFKMIPRRIGEDPVNFIFHASENGVTPEEYKGAAIVKRYPKNRQKISLPLMDVSKLLDIDPKGIVIIGFDDICSFSSPSRVGLNIEGDMAVLEKFTVISERRGCYE